MKQFILKTFLYLSSILSILIFIVFINNYFFEFEDSFRYDYLEFKDAFEKGKSDMIFLGNSKVQCAVDKKQIEKDLKKSVAMLGVRSSDISISKLILESYLNKCTTPPKTVLLEVSWFTFNNKRTSFHFPVVGSLFSNDFKLFLSNFFKYEETQLIYYSYCISKIKKLTSYFLKKESGDYNLTTKTKKNENSPYTKDYTFDIKKFKRVFPNSIAGVNSLLLRDFNSIINLCLINNINLVLFTAPEDQEYSNNQIDREIIKNIFNESNKKYKNLFYLDYTIGGDLYKKSYENWLADSHHIRHKNLFTRLLIKDLYLHTNITKP